MTPLAHYLARQMISLKREREHIWVEDKNRAQLRTQLADIHCFEMTGALPMLLEIGEVIKGQDADKNDKLFGEFSFLPAPKTWMEWRHGSGNRIGFLLVEGAKWHAVTFYCEMFANFLGYVSAINGDFYDGEPSATKPRILPTFVTDVLPPHLKNQSGQALLSAVHTMLILINSPQIIGRRQHTPHRGLERQINKFHGRGFPLHAWTEIKLEVAKPVEIDDGEPHQANLTGHRALHFVRKHIRIRRGRLEYVSAHWRGDASIGIKRSRYVVTA